jgi:E3 ubiquitin-protein ligase HERC4
VEGNIVGDINLVAAGSNSNWFTVNGKDCSQLTREPAIKVLDQKLLKRIQDIAPEETLDQDFIEELELIFCSLSCLNGSLLLPTHSGCSGNNNGVDFEAWKEAFTIIRECPNETIHSVVMSGLLSALGQVKPSPPDLETLRFYLILPMHSSSMQSPTNTNEFQIPYAFSIIQLPEPAGKAIEKWFSKAPVKWTEQLIKSYLKVVDPYLQMLKTDRYDPDISRSVSTSLIFLILLKRVNVDNGSPVSIETFYLHRMHEYYDIKGSYFKWKMARMEGKDTTSEFYICNFPFIFDPIAKEMILMADQEYSQQMAQQSEFQNAVFQFMTSGANQVVHPYLQIIVSRDNIVQDTITQLQFVAYEDPSTFKKPLKVTFAGEEAEDEGGVTKEFFLLLMKEILNPDYGMFKEYEESRAIWFNPASFEASEYFVMIGIVCGLAIYNFTIINLPFPLTLYKKILGEKTEEISDLAELSPLTAKSLQKLLDYEEEDFTEVFSLNFTISESYFGEVVSKPLKEGGENLDVTNENKEEYVKLYINHILNSSCKSQFDAFIEGFHKVVNKQVLQLFQAKELMALVIGNENYNWDEFKENCEYKEPYHKDHEVILMFWRSFKELTEEQKRKFLLFLTGCDRIPARGMDSVAITIQELGTQVSCQ